MPALPAATKTLSAWLLSVMTSVVPPGSSTYPDAAKESAEAGAVRYRAIARTIAKVTLDPAEAPLYAGEGAREKTAALLLAIAYHESGWRRDVDYGLGPHARGGGGRYHCLFQIGVPTTTPEGWTAADLTADREKCIRAALHRLHLGARVCKTNVVKTALRHYASGYCDRAGDAVQIRLDTLGEWLELHPLPHQAADAEDEGSPGGDTGAPRDPDGWVENGD